MGINLVLKTRIKFNGKEYGSADEMPADERQTYDLAMAAAADSGHENGMIIRTQMSSKIIFNGQEYDGVENMPLAARKTYEMAIVAMDASRSRALAAAGKGLGAVPPGVPAEPAAPTLRSPLNRTVSGAAAGSTSRVQSMFRVLLILGLLAGLIAVAVCLVLLRRAG